MLIKVSMQAGIFSLLLLRIVQIEYWEDFISLRQSNYVQLEESSRLLYNTF